MVNFRTSEDLIVGNIEPIYSDSKFQLEFEGSAVLLERKSKGLSYILYNENLVTKLEERTIDEESGSHMPFTTSQKESNLVFAKLTIALRGIKVHGVIKVHPLLKTFYNILQNQVSDDIDNPKVLITIINKFRALWTSEESELGDFINQFNNEQIVRYVQQTTLDSWTHSIWREEKWLVEFISDGFSSPFKTIRKIRTLVCINPKEDSQNSGISHYITKENSEISNADRKEERAEVKRKKRKLKQVDALAMSKAKVFSKLSIKKESDIDEDSEIDDSNIENELLNESYYIENANVLDLKKSNIDREDELLNEDTDEEYSIFNF